MSRATDIICEFVGGLLGAFAFCIVMPVMVVSLLIIIPWVKFSDMMEARRACRRERDHLNGK